MCKICPLGTCEESTKGVETGPSEDAPSGDAVAEAKTAGDKSIDIEGEVNASGDASVDCTL